MTGTAPRPTAGLRRGIWSAILERDVDFTLVDLLHTSSAFRHWLLAEAADDLLGGDPDADFLGAWHSVTTPNGESDVEAEWQLRDGRRLVVLIEDKIGAAFQPNQGMRYQERAANYRASGRAGLTRLVLVSPAAYPRRDPDGAASFERHIALERLRDWCRTAGCGERGAFIAEFLEQALRRAVNSGRASNPGGMLTPGSEVPAVGGKPMYPGLYAVVAECLHARAASSPRLSVTNSTPGEWVYFAFDGRGKGVSLRWRLRDHWAELVLSAGRITRERVEEVLTYHPLASAAVAARGTSEFVVWVPTSEVDLFADASTQREAISNALNVVNSLSTWYASTRQILEADVSS